MVSIAEKPWLQGYRLGPYKLPQTKEPYPKVTVHRRHDNLSSEELQRRHPGYTILGFFDTRSEALKTGIAFRDRDPLDDVIEREVNKLNEHTHV